MTNHPALAIGVDGCRGGWFWTAIEGDAATCGVVQQLADLLSIFDADRILVDIPIGLTSRQGGTRVCDALARKRLGRRSSSVFTPPCREALAADSYSSACDINEAVTGKRLSKQCWGIVPKIREADQVMRVSKNARGRIRESHPELCFAALAHGVPMQFNKKSAAGFQERAGLLRSIRGNSDDTIASAMSAISRSIAARDDIVDSLVLAVVAAMPDQHLESLSAEPTRDVHGLPMEVVLPSASKSS